jgi:uncharacterized protein (TIGR02453 family)
MSAGLSIIAGRTGLFDSDTCALYDPLMAFTGFPAGGLSFLTELGGQNRDWFQAGKARYDVEVAQPAKDFVTAMTGRLRATISPLLDGQPKTNGSIAPINNDLRFNPDAFPYKDHLLLKWWEGENKKVAPTLWIRLSEGSVGFASGMVLADLDRWRRAVGEDSGAALATAISALSKKHDLDVFGQVLQKVPKPWLQGHPRADLLRHKMFQVRWAEPTPENVTTEHFADWCTDRFAQLADIHHWLVDNLS